ncbi:hypothetical protein Tco_0932981, partial [Tanacetum coccineum]
KIHDLYYKVPHNGFSITVKLRNNYDMHVMFDISAAQGKLEIYIDHVGVNFIIAKYICLNASLAEMMNHVITDYTSDGEDERNEVTQNDYAFDQMVEWEEQKHFENEETKEVQRQKPIWKNRIQIVTSISPTTMATNPNDVGLTVIMALQEAHDEESCLEEQMLNLMHAS